MGCRLELLLESAPNESANGEQHLALRFDGAPLAGALVSAVPHGRPRRELSARTDALGRVSFPIGQADTWLFRTVHMEPLADASAPADWRSWWASLTVRLGEG